MSDEIRNVVVSPTTYPVPLPPHPDHFAVQLSGDDYQAAKNLRTLYQLIYQICPGSHDHYASFFNVDDTLPRNYSAKISCTGDGTSWRVVMCPEGVKGMVWYFCGLKRLDGFFNTAVIRYWDAAQCEEFVEALENGGIKSLPHNWRFVVHHDETDEDSTGTKGCNGGNVSEAEEQKFVGGL